MVPSYFKASVWLVAVFFAGFLICGLAPAAAQAKQTAVSGQGEEPRFIAYYFYTSKRCGPCKRIESWSQAAIRENFEEAIADGRLKWRAVNVEKPENKHFIKDFKLHTKSVVIVEQNEGKPIRWENLTKVWQLYRDKEKYFDYVAGQTRAFMEES